MRTTQTLNETASAQEANRPYDASFYNAQVAGSLESARHLLGCLYRLFQPYSVVDLGCGRGTWLKVCCELGSMVAHGYDGSWNNQANMVDQRIHFIEADLDSPLPVSRKYDLAISVEVAEHLRPDCALAFVTSLSRLSDVVLFSAAVPGQGGTHHINEQYQSYWGNLFSSLSFAIFDLFRPSFWHDERVRYWYRQNTFLYVRQGHSLMTYLRQAGVPPLTDSRFMDCIHPALYEAKLDQLRIPPTTMGFRHHLLDLIPSIVRGLKKRLP